MKISALWNVTHKKRNDKTPPFCLSIDRMARNMSISSDAQFGLGNIQIQDTLEYAKKNNSSVYEDEAFKIYYRYLYPFGMERNSTHLI